MHTLMQLKFNVFNRISCKPYQTQYKLIHGRLNSLIQFIINISNPSIYEYILVLDNSILIKTKLFFDLQNYI